MKIKIDKIVNHPIEIVRYLSDDIFEFKIDTGNLFEKTFQEFLEKAKEGTHRDIAFIDNNIQRGNLTQIGTREELVKTNLTHIYKAESYYTNGQKLLSLVKTDKGYEIGKHHSLQYFAGSFYNSIGVPSLKLESFQLETYQLKEIAETEMLEELSAVEIIRIPTLHDSDFDYIEARFVYPFTYHFKFNGIEISRTEGYPLPNLDTISVEIIQALKPKVLKCCRNCTHFKYSGMSYDMSGGRAGYCNVFTERLDKEHAREAVTNIWQWCDHFKQNERI